MCVFAVTAPYVCVCSGSALCVCLQWQRRDISASMVFHSDREELRFASTPDGGWQYRTRPTPEQVERFHVHAAEDQERLKSCLASLESPLEAALVVLKQVQESRWIKICRIVPIVGSKVSWRCGVLVILSLVLTAIKGATEALRSHYPAKVLFVFRAAQKATVSAKHHTQLWQLVWAMMLVEAAVHLLGGICKALDRLTQIDINASLGHEMLHQLMARDLEQSGEAKQLFKFIKAVDLNGNGGIAGEVCALFLVSPETLFPLFPPWMHPWHRRFCLLLLIPTSSMLSLLSAPSSV